MIPIFQTLKLCLLIQRDGVCYRHLLKYSKSSSSVFRLMSLTNLAHVMMRITKAASIKICQSIYDLPYLMVTPMNNGTHPVRIGSWRENCSFEASYPYSPTVGLGHRPSPVFKEEKADGGKNLVHTSGLLHALPFLCPYRYWGGKLTPQIEVRNISLRPPGQCPLIVIPGG